MRPQPLSTFELIERPASQFMINSSPAADANMPASATDDVESTS